MSLRLYDFIRVKPAHSNVTVSMPSGALGIWYAKDYDATARAIPNSAASNPLSSNIIRLSSGAFANPLVASNVSVSISDNAVAGVDGDITATTAVSTANNWWIQQGNSTSIPAGIYTLSIDVRSHSGVDELFAFSVDGRVTRVVKTATTVWSRQTHTFTKASAFSLNQISICSSNGATGASLEIDNISIHPGSSDLGRDAQDTNMYLGINKHAPTPVFSSNSVDFTSGLGLVRLPTTALPSFTVIAAFNKTANVSNLDSIFAAMSAVSTTFNPCVTSILGPVIGKGSTNVIPANSKALWDFIGQGWHTIAITATSSVVEFWIDDVLIHTKSMTTTTPTLRNLLVGAISSGGAGSSGCKYGAWAIYPSVLTNVEIRQAYQSLSYQLNANATPLSNPRILKQLGDSITSITFSPSGYASLYSDNASPKVIGCNLGIAGSGLEQLISVEAALDATLPSNVSGRKNILSIAIGTNNLAGAGQAMTVSQYLTALSAYCDRRRAAGWIVVVVTLLPRTLAGFNEIRATCNTEIRTWTTNGTLYPGKHADYIVDFDTEATVGQDASASNVTYYADGLHPTNAAHVLLEPVYRAVVNSI